MDLHIVLLLLLCVYNNVYEIRSKQHMVVGGAILVSNCLRNKRRGRHFMANVFERQLAILREDLWYWRLISIFTDVIDFSFKMAAAVGVIFAFMFVSSMFYVIVNSERTSQKIYKDLTADFACFRRLNGTNQIGCSSDRGGNVGVVHYVTLQTDLDWLLKHGLYAPYIVVINSTFFNFASLSQMQDSGKINGVLLVSSDDETAPELGLSPDQSCPNRGHGLYDSNSSIDDCAVNWNPRGDAMFFQDWSFPIFLVQKQSDIDSLLQMCYERFNAPLDGKIRTWPLCAAELLSNMYAARDAETCMRRSNMVTNLNPVKVCDPLGDYNIWSPLLPMNKSDSVRNRSLVFITARLDAFSMFDNFVPGGDSAVTGLVALLAIADALNRVKEEIQQKSNGTNVVFVIFNGEAFEYIGSSRMVFDMQQNVFPSDLDAGIESQPPLISLSHISHFIELNQVGISGSSPILWAHSDPLSTSKWMAVNSSVQNLISILQNQVSPVTNFNVTPSKTDRPLPPSSFQSFLKGDLEIPGLVLTDHDGSYTNKYYNSFFDVLKLNSTDSSLSIADFVHSTATVVSSAVYQLLTSEIRNINSSKELVANLLHCYTTGGNCSLVSQTTSKLQRDKLLKTGKPNMYVGVDFSMSETRVITTNLFSFIVGEQLTSVAINDCRNSDSNSILTYRWMPGIDGKGVCVRSTVNVTKAISPAFDIPDYDYSSARYSTWTESVWDEHSLRIFLKPSFRQEFVTLCIGILILIVSFVVVWFLNKNSDALFPNNGAGSVPATTTATVVVA